MTPPFIFFGSPDIAVTALEALHTAGFTPQTIVTAPDAPQGRGMTLTPPPVKVWAELHNIPVLQPTTLSDETFADTLRTLAPEFCIVVAYGKIIPQTILDIPPRGMLNVHPSLLPHHRGPSPIESQILLERDVARVGVSIMLLDKKMDHGPLLAQQSLAGNTDEWPLPASVLRPLLARIGAELLCKTLPAYLAGSITAVPQHDDEATFCKMITKEDALLDLTADAYTNYLKILAYDIWPRAYFFAEKKGTKMRVIVTHARFENDTLTIERVIPEGRREMLYTEFCS